jgi:hypothetical protein
MFESFKRVRRDDPVFGSMLYMGDELKYWEGKAHFAPTGTEIEVFVDGTSEDSMSQQHGFYESVCQRWSEWSAQITAKVRLEAEPDSRGNLQVSSMSIPKSQLIDDTEWEVSFSTQSSGYFYTVQMKGANPESIAWDS